MQPGSAPPSLLVINGVGAGAGLHKLARGLRFSQELTALHASTVLQVPLNLNRVLSYAEASAEARFKEDISILRWIVVNSRE